MPERMSEYMPAARMSDRMSNNFPQRMSNRMSAYLPESMSNRKSRHICHTSRWYFRNYVRIVCQGLDHSKKFGSYPGLLRVAKNPPSERTNDLVQVVQGLAVALQLFVPALQRCLNFDKFKTKTFPQQRTMLCVLEWRQITAMTHAVMGWICAK